MTKTIQTYIVDSFTDEPFKGNPAGVCILQEKISNSLMLSIAKELGLSETAFVLKKNKANMYGIRYFLPKEEIPLASAKVIFEKKKKLSQKCSTFGEKKNPQK